jgi:hypothetical protein
MPRDDAHPNYGGRKASPVARSESGNRFQERRVDVNLRYGWRNGPDRIQRNDAYILPHGEFKEEVQGLFDEIISGFPEGQQIDPVRLMFEDVRRRMTADAKAAIKAD